MTTNANTSPAPRPTTRPRWKRWALVLAASALVYTVLGFWILPWTARPLAVRQLRQALHREVQLHKIRFNPFTFVLEIQGLTIRDLDGSNLAGWELARVDFAVSSLFHGPWRFQEMTLEKPSARIQVNPDYTFNFSDLLPTSPPPENPPPPTPLPTVVVDRILVTDTRLSYTDLTPSTPFQREITLNRIELPGFSTAPGHTNSFVLQGSMDGGETLAWQGQTTLAPLWTAGRFTLNGFQIPNYRALYQDFLNLEVVDGQIDLSVDFFIALDDDPPEARLTDIQFSLDRLKVRLPNTPTPLLELDRFQIQTGLLDLNQRRAELQQVLLDGLRAQAHRGPDQAIDVVKVAVPPKPDAHTPGTALFMFEALTNARALFVDASQARVGIVHQVLITNTALSVFDEVPQPAVRLSVSDLNASVRELSTLPTATPEASLAFRWQTNGTFELHTQARFHPPSLKARFEIKDWFLGVLSAYAPTNLHIELPDSRLDFSGSLSLEVPPNAPPRGQFDGELALNHVHARHSLDDQDLLNWEAFRIEGISVQLHPLEASIQRVLLDGANLWTILKPTGQLNLLTATDHHDSILPAAPTPPPTEPTAPPTETAPPPAPEALSPPPIAPVHIASLQLTNATLHLVDQLTQPETQLVVQRLGGEISNISSTNLQTADFSFVGEFATGGKFQTAGQLRPLSGPDATRISWTTEALDLTPGTAYAGRFLGYELDRGRLSTDLTYTVQNGQLAASNHVVLDHLTLGRKVDSPDALSVPIKLGLAVLQDRNGRITLDVPVQGSLDDPQFQLGDVIRGAFANVFTKVVTSPFRALGSLFGSKDEDLDLLEFEPAQTELSPKAIQRLDTVAEILFERPGLSLEIVGLSQPSAEEAPLRKLRLTDTLRQRYWARLSPDEQQQLPLDHVKLTQDQLREQGRQLFREQHPRPEPSPPANPETPSLESPPAAINAPAPPDAPQLSPAAPAQTSVSLRPRRVPRGGEIMLQFDRRSRNASPSPTTPETADTDLQAPTESPTAADPPPEASPEPPLPPPEPSWEEIEATLLADVELNPADWEALGMARAQRVRDQLLSSRELATERLTIRSASEGHKPQPAVELELR